ncbi:competence protein CoiA family protein [Tranquillimonas alkanivorans]|nr:hypothetical protein [Tranquillimonas alkanivorans]
MLAALPAAVGIRGRDAVVRRAVRAAYEGLDQKAAVGIPDAARLIRAEELVNMSRHELHELRAADNLRCACCGGIVRARVPNHSETTSVSTIVGDEVVTIQLSLPWFQHAGGLAGHCPWSNGKAESLSEDEIKARIYQGRQESELHVYLKARVESILRQDPDFGTPLIEQRVQVGRDYRQADILVSHRSGRQFAVEIQVSPPLVSDIRNRSNYYADRGVQVLWITPEATSERLRAGFRDIAQIHAGMLFIATESALEASEAQGRFLFDAYDVTETAPVFEARCSVDDLNYPPRAAPYLYDATRERVRAAAEREAAVIAEELGIEPGTAVNLLDPGVGGPLEDLMTRGRWTTEIARRDSAMACSLLETPDAALVSRTALLALFEALSRHGARPRSARIWRRVEVLLRGIARDPDQARLRPLVIGIAFNTVLTHRLKAEVLDELRVHGRNLKEGPSEFVRETAYRLFPAVLRDFPREMLGRRAALFDWERVPGRTEPWERASGKWGLATGPENRPVAPSITSAYSRTEPEAPSVLANGEQAAGCITQFALDRKDRSEGACVIAVERALELACGR